MDAVSRAHVVGTGGDEAFVHPVMAQVAFLGDALPVIKDDGTVRARLYA